MLLALDRLIPNNKAAHFDTIKFITTLVSFETLFDFIPHIVMKILLLFLYHLKGLE